MFATTGLFKNLACPERDTCTRQNCLFSHSPDAPAPRPLIKQAPPVPSRSSASPSTSTLPPKSPPIANAKKSNATIVPAKRPALSSPTKSTTTSAEPPRKLQKIGSIKRPVAVPSSSTHTEVRGISSSFKLTLADVHIVGCTSPESQCSPVIGRASCQTG